MKYRTIVADPPWDVKAGPASGEYKVVDGVQVWNLATNKSRDLAFQPMSVAVIAALPVADLAESDAHLYLWTTNGYLPQAFDVIRAWGFHLLNDTRLGEESVWRGRPWRRVAYHYGVLPRSSYSRLTWNHVPMCSLSAGSDPRRAKSKTAGLRECCGFFLDQIEQVSPGPYLEMFARRQRLGWDTWGNEALEHVTLGASA